MQSVTRVFTYKHADNWTVTGSETELLKSRNNNNNNNNNNKMKSVTEPERVCVYLPVDGVEEADEGVDGGREADEGVDGGREAGAQFGGDATKEVGNNIGVLVEGRAPTQRRPPSLSPSLARSRSLSSAAADRMDLLSGARRSVVTL
jgi:hypothetical protein